MEKVLWLIKRVKSGLQSCVLEIFLLDDAPQSGRSVEVASEQIETFIETNQHYTT